MAPKSLSYAALRRCLLALVVAVPPCFAIEVPGAKLAINTMAVMIRQHVQWDNWTSWSKAMAPFWADNFTYDFAYPFGKTHGLRDWYLGEHLHYNKAFPYFKSTNFLYLGEGDRLASLQSYHTVRWKGEFAGIPAPADQPLIRVKDLDFYIIEDNKILYNWCLVDIVAILQQGGYHVLPPPPLPNAIDYLPARAMDGIPSPDDKYVNQEDTESARKVFNQMLQEDFVSQSTEARTWAPDLQWCGPAVVGLARTPQEYVQHFLKPLHKAFPWPVLQIGSSDCEGAYCGALFYLVAEQTGPWLGEEPTGKRVRMKIGMHARVDFSQGAEGLIVDAWVQLDVLEAFAQMGVDLLARAKEQAARRPPAWALSKTLAAGAPPPAQAVVGARLLWRSGAVVVGVGGCLAVAVFAVLWLARHTLSLSPSHGATPTKPLLA